MEKQPVPIRTRGENRARRSPLAVLCRLYVALLFGWFLLHLLFGDGGGYLGLANAVAIFFFVPLPLALIVGAANRDRVLLAGGLLAVVLFASLWGPLFWPNGGPVTEGPRLRVMTFNVLGRAGDNRAAVGSILAEDADVLFLQEVTPEAARLLEAALKEAYAYRVVQPGERARGMAVFSKYPLSIMDVVLEGRWMGSPQVLQLDWEGQMVTLVNFHTRSTGNIWPPWVLRTFSERQSDLQLLADFAAVETDLGPVIVAGDANETQLNRGYKILTSVLTDAWWEAGRGLGHTFPGPVEAGDNVTRVSLFLVPHWLVRIDYIFYSRQWQARETWLADFSGGTDHRGVVAELILVGGK